MKNLNAKPTNVMVSAPPRKIKTLLVVSSFCTLPTKPPL